MDPDIMSMPVIVASPDNIESVRRILWNELAAIMSPDNVDQALKEYHEDRRSRIEKMSPSIDKHQRHLLVEEQMTLEAHMEQQCFHAIDGFKAMASMIYRDIDAQIAPDCRLTRFYRAARIFSFWEWAEQAHGIKPFPHPEPVSASLMIGERFNTEILQSQIDFLAQWIWENVPLEVRHGGMDKAVTIAIKLLNTAKEAKVF